MFTLRPGTPTFEDLPWSLPLAQWQGVSTRLEEMPIGITRHPVVFINYEGHMYVFKEMPPVMAIREYEALVHAEALGLPAVHAIGFAEISHSHDQTGVLITQYLNHSIPYRSIFMGSRLTRYRNHLLDSIASLLVQLHLAGFYWGDCSLSNILYRRDAGALSAYLVDAETAIIYPNMLSPALRHQELDIMEENVDRDLAELSALNFFSDNVQLRDTSAYIRQRYSRLWEEINHEELIAPNENYRIQERIRALNNLGYSVGDVELTNMQGRASLRLRVVVTDRNFHRNQLFDLTGVETEEMQARKMINEIHEIKATLGQSQNRPITLSAAAYNWLENIYRPTLSLLQPLEDIDTDAAELYCQLLEHKWYLSETARQDVGHASATEDYIRKFSDTPKLKSDPSPG